MTTHTVASFTDAGVKKGREGFDRLSPNRLLSVITVANTNTVWAELVEARPFFLTGPVSFWAYMIQCADRHLYVGHTNDLEVRFAQHQAGTYDGYTSTRQPLHLMWCQEFGSRDEAVRAERQIKGWSRAKKLALIRGDWDRISALARAPQGKGRASPSSAQTAFGGGDRPLFLHPHPAFSLSKQFSLEVRARLSEDRCKVHFSLNGPTAILALPPRTTSARRDELWRHTCFETFLQHSGGYLEYNLSPSTEWAAYGFTGYREGMTDLDVDAPAIRVTREDRSLSVQADLALPAGIVPTRIGLSAVIEEQSGRKSYWALRHPPGEVPDFHHPDCFALELPPPAAP